MSSYKAKVAQLRSSLSQFRVWRVRRKGVFIESLLFVALYAALLYLFSQDATALVWIEGLAVMVSMFTAALLIFFSLSGIAAVARHAWFMLAVALLVWTIAALLKLLFNLIPAPPQVLQPLAASINLAAYIIAAYALLRFPSGGRYAAPTRFRFILDVLISSVAVAGLGWLMLDPPALNSLTMQLALVIILSAPIADLILLVIFSSVLLTSVIPRVSATYLAAGLVSFALSDYLASSLEILGLFRPGSLISLGWVGGALLIGIGGMHEKLGLKESNSYNRRLETGLSAQFQKVLPIVLVLVLFWYVFTDWRLRGSYSTIGVWMSLVLGLMLIVRLGIRAGEAELNNYWQLFKNLGDPAFICDAAGNINLSNPAYQKLETPGEGKQALFSTFANLPEGALRNISEKKSAGVLDVSVSSNEREIPYLLSLNPVETESRQVLIAGVAHNLSEQIYQRNTIQTAYDELHAVHGQLEELNARLEQKVVERTATLMDAYRRLEEQNIALQELDRLKSDFVSMVSHELRNPLNNLGGGLELLLARSKSQKTDKDALALMQTEVRRLTRFVESILDVSAIEAGRFKLHLAPVSLDPVFESIGQHWGASYMLERIQVELQPDLPKVTAAKDALESVLLHLVDNAIKYAPDGPVIVSAAQQKRQVRIEVRDFGPGIPDDKQNLLFERFQRLDAKDSQSVYGYGLGLYLSRRILEEMGSTLKFDTPADGGARFSFTLKVAKT